MVINWGSKFLWINIIAVIIQIGQYIAGQHYWPVADVPIAITLASLQIISNMLSGAVVSGQVVLLKKKVARLLNA
jgi:hypothetical protein